MHGWPPPQHLFGHQVGQILTIWAKGGMDFCSTILRIRLHPMHPMFFSHFIHLKKLAGASISTCICDPFVYWPWGDSYFRFPCGPMLDLRLDLSCRIAAGGLADGLEFGKVSNVKRSAWNARKTPSYNYAVYFTGVCTDLSGNDGGDMEGQVGWLYKVVITFDDTQVVEAWESRRECPQTQSQWLLTYKAQRNSQDLGGAAHTIIM